MRETQRAVVTAIETWIVDNVPTAATLFALLCAGLMIAASFVYPTPLWRATTVRVMGLVLALGALAVRVGRTDWLADVDYAVTDWVISHRSPVVDPVALAITNLFGPAAAMVVTGIVAAGIGWWRRSAVAALTVIVTVGGAAAIAALIKVLVARSRPPLMLREVAEQGYSFPSGHVTAAAALLGIATVIIGRSRRRAVQAMLTAIAVGAVCVVAMTRVYLGVHWLSDVVAGALLGALAVSLAASALCTRGDGRRPGIAPEMFPPNGLESRRAAASRGPDHAETSTSSAITDRLGLLPPPTEGVDRK